MRVAHWARRAGACLTALSLGTLAVLAAEPPLLDWPDLIPPEQAKAAATTGLRGLVTHEQGVQIVPDAGTVPAGVRRDLNGKEVRIAGYLVPLGLDGTKIKEFLIAPFLGACIHVPPPPANQLVLTRFKAGLEMSLRLFSDPIIVTGKIGTTAVDADLGEQGSTPVGYEMDATQVRFFEQ